MNKLHTINPVYLRLSSQVTFCLDLFDVMRRKDLQILQLRVSTHSLHLFTRLTYLQALGRISAWCFCRMILLTVPQELL